MIKVINKLRWPLVVLAFLAALFWAVFVAFGEHLNIAQEARDDVRTALAAIWGFVLTTLTPVFLIDKNENGVLDIFESEKDK